MTGEQFNFVLHSAVGVLLVGLGIPLWRGKVPPNAWFGFRTPTTRSDQRIWYPANRIAGLWMMATGAVTVATCAVTFLLGLKTDVAAWVNLGAITAMVAAMTVHCFIKLGQIKREVTASADDRL